MSSPNRFPNLSARVLNALDRDFPGWQDLVPAEKDAELNEESLIDLLKDRKRAEIYRTVADKRNAFLKEAYEGLDKSFAELTQEFAAFSYGQTHKWFDMEEKLSSIKLEFRAKAETIDIEGVEQSLDFATEKIGERVDGVIDNFNSSMDNALDSFFNKDVNGVSRVDSSELKGFLRSKVNQFKGENKKIADSQKKFLNTRTKKLIQEKVDRIKSGELDANALDRSDLFTDEEVRALEEAQEQVLVDAISDRVKSNVGSVNEMSQKFIGVSGKENILEYLDKCPKHIVTDELKSAVSEAIDNGCIFGDDDVSSNRRKRSSRLSGKGNVVSLILDNAAFALSQLADDKVEEAFNKENKIYEFCNSGTYYTAHVFTLGWCSVFTILTNIDAAVQGKPIDYAGISAVLSGISFFIGIGTGESFMEVLKDVIVPNVAQIGCTYLDKGLKKKNLSKICSTTVLIYSHIMNRNSIIKKLRKQKFKNN